MECEMVTYLIQLLAGALAVVVILTLHEFAHAYVAHLCGDPTPKWNGRLTLNPLKHFDILGLICFAVVGFGWAKPVPINPNNFKQYRTGLGLTASAGIIANLITAFLIYPLVMVVSCYMPQVPFIYEFVYFFFYFMFVRSLSFAVFNLLPLYPLDGFRIVDALNRRRGKVFRFLRENGEWILLGLIVESFICQRFVDFGVGIMSYFDILGWFMNFAVNIIGYPITALWGLIPW